MEISAIVCRGHQGASGTGPNFGNTCEGGSIRRQDIAFKQIGFDYRHYLGTEPYWGTLNCYIGRHPIDPLNYIHQIAAEPRLFPDDYEFDPKQTKWSHVFDKIIWHLNWPPERFFLLKGQVAFNNIVHPAYVYYPDPSSKPNNPIPNTIIEIVAPPIPFADKQVYGQKISLQFLPDQLAMNARYRQNFPS